MNIIRELTYDVFVYKLALGASVLGMLGICGWFAHFRWKAESIMIAYGHQVKSDYEAAFAANSTRLEQHYGEALRISTVRRHELEAIVANVAETWQNNTAAAADVITSPTSLDAKRRRREAQEAHRRAADAAVAAVSGPASRTPVPASGVRVILAVKEVANG